MIRVSLSLSPRLLVIAHPPPPCILSLGPAATLFSFASGSKRAPSGFLFESLRSSFRWILSVLLDTDSIQAPSRQTRDRNVSPRDDVSPRLLSSVYDRTNCFCRVACSWRVLKGNRLRYSSGHCGIERGLENNERKGRGRESGCQLSRSSRNRYFFPLDRLTIGFHPSPPISLRFSRDRTAELALIFTSCDCKNGEPFGERYMLKICRVAIWLNGNGDASSRLQLSFYK